MQTNHHFHISSPYFSTVSTTDAAGQLHCTITTLNTSLAPLTIKPASSTAVPNKTYKSQSLKTINFSLFDEPVASLYVSLVLWRSSKFSKSLLGVVTGLGVVF